MPKQNTPTPGLSSAQSKLLPFLQLLAGAAGGFATSKAQQARDPYNRFSAAPVIAGSLKGLTGALGTKATRGEALRQEQRKKANAIAQLAITTGLTPDQIQTQFPDMTDFDIKAAQGLASRGGNNVLFDSLGVQNPSGQGGNATPSILGPLLQGAQEHLQNQATTSALNQAMNAGQTVAGGNLSQNALDPRVSQAMAIQALGGPEAIRPAGQPANIIAEPTAYVAGPSQGPVGQALTRPSPINPSTQGVQQAQLEVDPSVSPFNPLTAVLSGGVQQGGQLAPLNPGIPQQGGGQTLRDIALQSPNPQTLINAFMQAATAANNRNTQETQVFNTGVRQEQQAENNRLRVEKPTTGTILAGREGSEALTNLINYAQAGGATLRPSGIEKPVTHSVAQTTSDGISKIANSGARIAKVMLAVENGTLTVQQGVNAFNAGAAQLGEAQLSVRRLRQLMREQNGGT